MKCVRCGETVLESQAMHYACAYLESCSACEKWVSREFMSLTEWEIDKGFIFKVKCPECGDISLIPRS